MLMFDLVGIGVMLKKKESNHNRILEGFENKKKSKEGHYSYLCTLQINVHVIETLPISVISQAKHVLVGASIPGAAPGSMFISTCCHSFTHPHNNKKLKLKFILDL